MSSATGRLDAIKFAPWRMRHRLQRIAEQVDQNLLDLDPIDQHQIVLRVEIEAKLDALFAGAGEAERAGFLDQLGEAFDALFGFAARDEIAQPPDDLAGAKRLLGGAIQRAFDLGLVGIGAGRQQPARTLHVVADGGERLVEFVRQRRGHLSHRAQARDVNELGLQFLKPRLGLLMLGQIADKAGEVGRAAGLHFADRKMHRESRAVLALAGHDPADADDMPLAGGSVARQVPVMARTVGLGHQHADVLADSFVLRCSRIAARRRC